jgi:hypothetical protein
MIFKKNPCLILLIRVLSCDAHSFRLFKILSFEYECSCFNCPIVCFEHRTLKHCTLHFAAAKVSILL